MKKSNKQSLLYLMAVIFIYIILGIIEFFFGSYILDIITDNQWIQLIVFIICLLIINPIITAIISNKVPYNPEGLKELDKPKNLNKK